MFNKKLNEKLDRLLIRVQHLEDTVFKPKKTTKPAKPQKAKLAQPKKRIRGIKKALLNLPLPAFTVKEAYAFLRKDPKFDRLTMRHLAKNIKAMAYTGSLAQIATGVYCFNKAEAA